VEGLAAIVLALVIVASSLAGLDRWRAAGQHATRLARSRSAAGAVTGTEPESATTWHPVVRFTDDDGHERTVRAPARNREHWPRPPDTVTIRYDPQDPGWIAFEGEKSAGTATRGYAVAYFSWAAAMLVGLIILLLGAH
jgi:hypothetical protein